MVETKNEKALSERRAKALNLRMAGASYMDIVKAGIGYSSVSHVSHDMRSIVAEFQYEQPEDVLVLDLARLDELQKYLTFAFRSGDYHYASLIMQVMKFRRETLGITPELIEQRRAEKTQIQNNGIMVIQGATTGDYLESMMRAAGASPEEAQAQRERLALESSQNGSQEVPTSQKVSNSTVEEIVDAEYVEDSDVDNSGINDLTKRLKRAVTEDAARQQAEQHLDQLAADEPMLSVDVVEEDTVGTDQAARDSSSPAQQKKKKLVVRVKHPDVNQAATAGVVYRKAPRKPVIKLIREHTDELETSTVEEQI